MIEQKTDVLTGSENIQKFLLDRSKATRQKVDICHDYLGPSRMVKIKSHREVCLSWEQRGVKIRYLTDIRKENLSYCKEILQIKHLQMRHMDGVKGNFGVEDGTNAYLVVHAVEKEAEPVEHAIYTTVQGVVEGQQYIFDSLWTKAMPAEYRIIELEEGIEPDIIEILRDPNEIQTLAFNLLKAARDEILIMLSVSNPLIRKEEIEFLELLHGAALLHKVKIKLLTSPDEQINDWQTNIGSVQEIEIRNIEPVLYANLIILVVDKKFSLLVEVKEERKESSDEAIGLACYSNSRLTVSGYSSIFEALWKQSQLFEKLTKLYEEVRIHNVAQNDFIATIAHELRNPLQSITGLSDILCSRDTSISGTYDATKEDEMLNIIHKNANRLQLLTEDILDVAKIEAKTLKLNKVEINLNQVIDAAIQDHQKGIIKSGKQLDLIFSKSDDNNLMIVADENRIYQVMSNLINNAIRSTSEGFIKIDTSISDNGNGKKHITVYVIDTGTGINPEILPQLFTKFSTKSSGGTGLGLFICKSIVEAHGGKIWGYNNVGEKGATFGFSLPLT